MTDRPILFSAPMVRALLDGRKTMTRRILKPVKGLTLAALLAEGEKAGGATRCARHQVQEPKWQAGDRLWVREAGNWRTAKSMMSGRDVGFTFYAADSKRGRSEFFNDKNRPSIFMPRWASRLTLHVSAVKVERLQDINEEDAIAEGIEPDGYGGWKCYLPEPKPQDSWACPRESYRTLWETINGAGSWANNPWVAAIGFRVVKANINAPEVAAA